jgi:hypothetical protein
MSFPYEPLTRTECSQIHGLGEQHGDRGAAHLLLVDLATYNKALAHRQLRASTIQCIRSRLRELAAAAARQRGVR